MKSKKLDKNAQLVKLGLTNHQALVYCALLEQGDSTVLKLSTATKLNRITVHKVVDELVNIGLVFSTVSGKRRLLSAAPPEALQNLIVNQEKELIEKREMTGDLINSLYQSINKVKDRTDSEVKFYEGYKAVSELYDEILLCSEVRAIVNSSEINKIFPENMSKFIDALSNGAKVWNLLTFNNHKPSFVKLEETFIGYKAKFLPEDVNDLGAIDYLLFKGNIVMVQAGSTPRAIRVRNEVYYNFAEQMYKLLWRLL